MQTNFGKNVLLKDILSHNYKKQSWDPWLPNSYICADEQPVQPIPHDPKLQGSMPQQFATRGMQPSGDDGESAFIASMNNAKANGDQFRYQTMLRQWQANMGISNTSRVWYDATDPKNYFKERLIRTIQNINCCGNCYSAPPSQKLGYNSNTSSPSSGNFSFSYSPHGNDDIRKPPPDISIKTQVDNPIANFFSSNKQQSLYQNVNTIPEQTNYVNTTIPRAVPVEEKKSKIPPLFETNTEIKNVQVPISTEDTTTTTSQTVTNENKSEEYPPALWTLDIKAHNIQMPSGQSIAAARNSYQRAPTAQPVGISISAKPAQSAQQNNFNIPLGAMLYDPDHTLPRGPPKNSIAGKTTTSGVDTTSKTTTTTTNSLAGISTTSGINTIPKTTTTTTTTPTTTTTNSLPVKTTTSGIDTVPKTSTTSNASEDTTKPLYDKTVTWDELMPDNLNGVTGRSLRMLGELTPFTYGLVHNQYFNNFFKPNDPTPAVKYYFKDVEGQSWEEWWQKHQDDPAWFQASCMFYGIGCQPNEGWFKPSYGKIIGLYDKADEIYANQQRAFQSQSSVSSPSQPTVASVSSRAQPTVTSVPPTTSTAHKTTASSRPQPAIYQRGSSRQNPLANVNMKSEIKNSIPNNPRDIKVVDTNTNGVVQVVTPDNKYHINLDLGWVRQKVTRYAPDLHFTDDELRELIRFGTYTVRRKLETDGKFKGATMAAALEAYLAQVTNMQDKATSVGNKYWLPIANVINKIMTNEFRQATPSLPSNVPNTNSNEYTASDYYYNAYRINNMLQENNRPQVY